MPQIPNHEYEIIIYWSQADEASIAEVPELPGCAADGGSSRQRRNHHSGMDRDRQRTWPSHPRPARPPRLRLTRPTRTPLTSRRKKSPVCPPGSLFQFLFSNFDFLISNFCVLISDSCLVGAQYRSFRAAAGTLCPLFFLLPCRGTGGPGD